MTMSGNANEVNALKPILTVQSDEAKPFDNMRIAGSVNISMNFVDFVLIVCHIISFLFSEYLERFYPKDFFRSCN